MSVGIILMNLLNFMNIIVRFLTKIMLFGTYTAYTHLLSIQLRFTLLGTPFKKSPGFSSLQLCPVSVSLFS